MRDFGDDGADKKKILTLDIDYYQGFLDDMDIPADKKRELVETLWGIVVNFVDMGFGVHPVQLASADKPKRPNNKQQDPIRELERSEA